MELIAECAKNNRASKSKYRKVWKALVACTEGVLSSGRGVIVEKLGTVTYVSRSAREGGTVGHRGCIFVANPKFARTFSVLQRESPPRSLRAPAVPISCARIGHTAGVEHDYSRVALAAIMDAIGRRICSGSKLCLPFGGVGSLVAKDRYLSFAFAERFQRPTANPVAVQDKYDNNVRRILTAIEANKKSGGLAGFLAGSQRANSARPETSPQTVAEGREPRARTAGGPRGRTAGGHRGRTAGGAGGYPNSDGTPWSHAPLPRKNGGSPSRVRSGNRTASEPLILSVRSSAPSSAGEGAAGSARSAPARSQRQGTPAGRDALLEGPETPTPRATLAGSAAMVAGGPRAPRTEGATRAQDDMAALRAKVGLGGSDGVDVSPRTAKKVLPHFLAIGNPGSQALVATEGAEIVQKQARERFDRLKAANLLLDEKEFDETKNHQHAKWKEYDARQTEEKKRLRDYLVAVKKQADSQRVAKADKKSGDFLQDNPDPGRAYPCRIEYDIVKEQAWRKAWCEDLEKQIELKRRLEQGIRTLEVSRDRVRAAQLDAAVNADRRREMEVQRLDRERINKAWETQLSSFAHPEGGKRVQSIILDKIVR